MSYLSSLYSKLSGLNSQKAEIEAELKMLRERCVDVKGLNVSLANVSDTSYSLVNKFAEKILDNFSFSLKGTKSVPVICNSVSEGKEKSSGNDSNVSGGLVKFQDEISQVEKKITDLETELSRVNSNISSTKSAISSEEKRIAEENQKAQEESE